MSATRTRRRPRARVPDVLQKPAGVFHPRVQAAGPDHFGIVAIDCAKARSKWLLADFYGNVLVPPTPVEHTRTDLDAAVARLREAVAAHGLRDLVVAVERTGRYHHATRRAFAAAGFEVRIVHPLATKHFRQPQDPGNKTDDTDLAAIHRAAVSGFALVEQALDEDGLTLRLLVRHRRDQVGKMALLCCQIREHLDAAFPGFAACFADIWDRSCAWRLVRTFDSPQALRVAGEDGLCRDLQGAGVRYHLRSVRAVLAWAATAAAPDLAAAAHRTIALALDDDRTRKTQEISTRERDLAGRLARTPYVLLLTCPGINVVSAAELAGAMGPIQHYANSRAITGRAGLRPSRYQSDQVDRPHGPLVRACNRRLRAALLTIAENLVVNNHHFQALATRWAAAGKDPRHTRVRVASRFARIAYQMVAGGRVFRHPCLQDRHYLLHKLTTFHTEHDTPAPQVLRDLEAALAHVPKTEYRAEAAPLHEELRRLQEGRRRGPQPLADILPIVLARLGVAGVESTTSGEPTSR